MLRVNIILMYMYVCIYILHMYCVCVEKVDLPEQYLAPASSDVSVMQTSRLGWSVPDQQEVNFFF